MLSESKLGHRSESHIQYWSSVPIRRYRNTRRKYVIFGSSNRKHSYRMRLRRTNNPITAYCSNRLSAPTTVSLNLRVLSNFFLPYSMWSFEVHNYQANYYHFVETGDWPASLWCQVCLDNGYWMSSSIFRFQQYCSMFPS